MGADWRAIITHRRILVGAILFIGLLGGVFFDRVISRIADRPSCVSSLTFIKPTLNCNLSDEKSQNLSDLQERLKVSIEGYQSTGKAKRISVFVRDLTSSRFAGVNDNDIYYMASLLKLPLLIGGYKLAEVEPKILDQEIEYTGKPNLYDEQSIKPKEELKIGATYAIRELMRRAVVYSDNTAAQLLFDYYPKEFIDRILAALGIQLVRPTGEIENLITARTYANVFRILYNSSYLTREYSDNALLMLTQSTFADGATAKLPASVVVAHKFAERTIVDQMNPARTIRQLHECGIVYAKQSSEPYSFCIMTEGNDYQDLEEVLQNVSLSIYESMVDGGS